MTSPQSDNLSIAQRLDRVEQRVVEACRAFGRERHEITLLPVSKRQPVHKLKAAIEAGVERFGENQVQEACTKSAELPPTLEWHFIGHLQSNKTRSAVRLFDIIHSVDRLKIAHAIEREAKRQGRRLRGFLQVNIGDEETKGGFSAEGLVDAARQLAQLEHLEIVGLMTLPPFEEDPEAARRWFRRLRALRDDLAAHSPWQRFDGLLSMGMSHDLEMAIAEGATHLRIGTSIFGPRDT